MNRPTRHPPQGCLIRLDEKSPAQRAATLQLPTYLPDFSIAPAANSVSKNAAISTAPNAPKTAPSIALPPLNIMGGGRRFLGGRTTARTALVDAVIDAELGTPARKAITSADGVSAFVLRKASPKRRLSARDAAIDASFKCLDCKARTDTTGEYYMVRQEIWLTANPSSDGMLCIGCIESRLGRMLVPEDFTDAKVNDPTCGMKSTRLLSRITGKAVL